MSNDPYKPIIFISYAHADESEKPAADEIKWLSFVTGYLRSAVKHGHADIWIDRLMCGGDDVNPEIERKLRACDIFILLVSRHSLSSDYIVDKEIAIIRGRQAKGEDVHFYPLLLTPTPKIALKLVLERNLRPRDGTPFFDYPLNVRYRHMSDAADEIAEIAGEIAARKKLVAAKQWDGQPGTAMSIIDSLRAFFKGTSGEVAITIAARAALRVVPLAARVMSNMPSAKQEIELGDFIGALFRSAFFARVASVGGTGRRKR
jgi:hypothetical protein